MSHILLTGLPGVGKTTLIRELAKRLADYQPAGFCTEEIRERGSRQGFRVETLDGRKGILAHRDYKGPYRVGRYGVDVDGFERLLAELGFSRLSTGVIVIDEIGKMECCSKRFIEEMTTLLDSPRTVVATIALKGEGFIRQVKERPDCRLVTVTVDNRKLLGDRLLEEVVDGIRQRESQVTKTR